MKKGLPLILLFIFAISILLRWPLLSDGLNSWETGNVFMLTTLKIWAKKSATEYHFSPIQTWPNPGDKGMHVYKRLEDRQGNNYYVSHPPFAFLLGYFYFYLSGDEPAQIPLQLMGFLLHFLGALAVFGLVFSFTKDSLAALVSFSVFTFYPVLLFGFTFHFFSEIIGISFWVIVAWFVHRLINKNTPLLWECLALGLINLVLVYTDWMGVFFTVSTFAFLLMGKVGHPNRLLLSLGMSAGLGLLLILLQYASIAGFSEMLHSMGTRLAERSGFFGEAYSDQQLSLFNVQSYILLAKQFHHQMQWLGYGFMGLALLVLASKKLRAQVKFPSAIWWLIVIPALLHLVLFFNTNVLHYVYQAKWAVIAAFFSGLLLAQLQNRVWRVIAFSVLALALVGSVHAFKVDIPEDRAGEDLKKLAAEIGREISPGQSVYISSDAPINLIYLNYLLERNTVAYSAKPGKGDWLVIKVKGSKIIEVE